MVAAVVALENWDGDGTPDLTTCIRYMLDGGPWKRRGRDYGKEDETDGEGDDSDAQERKN